VSKVNDVLSSALTRRNFLVGAGSAAAVSAVGCGGTFMPQTTPVNPPAPQYTDGDYLNFALNLEYLEATYYLIATTGTGLSSADTGGTGKVTGGSQVVMTSAEQEYANEIAQDELDHVRFIRSALGTSAVTMPAVNLVDSFNAAAVAAGVGASFNPFASWQNFLVGAFLFEDVGVTAYRGAAPLLTDKGNLGAAAGIMAVEAYHAALLRTLIIRAGEQYIVWANQFSALRATLSGGGETMLSSFTIAAADTTNALAFSRSTNQILNIVYGNAGGNVTSGGFFPSGLNGTINTTNA
jgi:Ferritin-like domain